MPHEITNLNRRICGVDLYVETTDPEKVEKIKKALDQAMRITDRAGNGDTRPKGKDFMAGLERMFGTGKVKA